MTENVRRVGCLAGLVFVVALTACGRGETRASAAGSDTSGSSRPAAVDASGPVDLACAWPSDRDTLAQEDGAILQVWSLSADPGYFRHALPGDPGLLAYRDSVREMGGDVRYPELQIPDSVPPGTRGVWRDETHNNELVYSGEVGAVTPITCLDALLFAEQNRRVDQLERPTEFLASVLRDGAGERLVVVFGAGDEMFPPTSVHGFDVVEAYVDEGWDFRYLLHNHTLQPEDGRSMPGVPAPSTSDVGLARALAERLGLESVRVTNGFYTFIADVEELSELRAR